MIKLDKNGNPIVIHYGAKEFNPKKFTSIKNDNWCKPRGGLWTSPVGSEWGWKEWCDSEHFRDCEESVSFKLQFEDNVKIYKIDSLKDLQELPHTGDRFGFAYPDFEKIVKSYNAIWLTSKGQNETRFSRPYNLYGWDCESILILDKKCFSQVSSFCYI